MRMLTRHGDEIVDELLIATWEEYKEFITCIDVTPVNKFMHRHKDTFVDVREDFGCVRPPWKATWAEYVVQEDNELRRVGMDIHPVTDDEMEDLRDGLDEGVRRRALDNDEAEHVYAFVCTVDLGSSWIAEGITLVFLDEDGRIVSDPIAQFVPMPYDRMIEVCESAEHARTILAGRCFPVLLGFGFAHCPNVTIWEDEKPEPVREKRKKSGKNPGRTFKCLDIEPLQEDIRRKSSGSEDGDADRAKHTVRGHFKHYTEDAPLFGHYTGNVWVPAHERGSESEGTVEKEYRSQAPGYE